MAFRIYIVFIAFKYLRGCGYDMSKCFVWCQFDNDDKVEGRWVCVLFALSYLYLTEYSGS